MNPEHEGSELSANIPETWYCGLCARTVSSFEVHVHAPTSACPTCGSPVRVETSDEGTSHYVPLRQGQIDGGEF